MTTLILPRNPLGRGIDSAFDQVLDAANVYAHADTTTATVDHDALAHDELILQKSPFADVDAVYHGWMCTAGEYGFMWRHLHQKGMRLLTTPTQYQTAHFIDGWLDAFNGLTFPTVILRHEFSEEDAQQALAGVRWEQVFVKDFVKSRKGEDFVVPLDQAAATAVRFRDAQEEFYAEGIALRQFIPLAGEVEVRGWWREGEWQAFTPHPDYAGELVPSLPQRLLDEVRTRLESLKLRFVTVDFALTASGTWVVVEVGDGQVSGFPADTEPSTIVGALGI